MPGSTSLTNTSSHIHIEKTRDLAGLSRAFRPAPLSGSDLNEFYSDSLNKCRANYLGRQIKDSLLGSVETGFYFQGIVYGNRGVGKSTEINRLLAEDEIQRKFVVIRLDATGELNPQTFSVADVLIVLMANLIQVCEEKCKEVGHAFNEAGIMAQDIEQVLAPFFPDLQGKEQITKITGGSGEINLLSLAKLTVRVEGQRKLDSVIARQSLAQLSAALDRQISAVQQHLRGYELLVIGENFDREQISAPLLHDTFVQYSSVLRDLRLHLLFTLPVPFVHAYGEQLAFRRENRYAVYDVPIFKSDHQPDHRGKKAMHELLDKRCDESIFDSAALDLLITASGGDLHRLFAMIIHAGNLARYRHEDEPETEARVLPEDARKVVLEQLSIFRNELGTVPNDPDDTSWEEKRQKLLDVYNSAPSASVPDKALYQLIRRRAVLFFNGAGRYGVHPLAVEILREQFRDSGEFTYRGGGLPLEA